MDRFDRFYKLSRHAAGRMAQRNVSQDILELILLYGESRKAGGDSESLYLSRSTMEEVIGEYGAPLRRRLNGLRAYAIVAGGRRVVTVAYARRRRRSAKLR